MSSVTHMNAMQHQMQSNSSSIQCVALNLNQKVNFFVWLFCLIFPRLFHVQVGVFFFWSPFHSPHLPKVRANANEVFHTYKWILFHIWMRFRFNAMSISHTSMCLFFFFSNNSVCLTYRKWEQIWMRFVTHVNESWHTYECVMSSNMWMRHVTHMIASRHTYESVISHIWMSYITHMNESCHTYECVMLHTWMSHVTHMNASCHTYECVMSHTWMRHVTHMNASCHTHEWVTSMHESCHSDE